RRQADSTPMRRARSARGPRSTSPASSSSSSHSSPRSSTSSSAGAMREVMSSEAGWHYTGQWWIWVLVMAAIVYLLTYRDIRISTTAGVILGAFEIGIFGALAVWMILSNTGDLNLQPFNPHHADWSWSGVFRGMVFAILAFIGFEAAAPLGEEAKNPRLTVTIAVVG